MKRPKRDCFHHFLITITLIGFTQAEKLCDFAEKFPFEGKHCLRTLCPTNMIYGNIECSRSCKDPDNTMGCVNVPPSNLTCVCDQGFYTNGTHCVPEEHCGCYLTDVGILKDRESYINEDCTIEYTCINNSLVIDNTYKCSANATCEVRDDARGCYCNDGFSGDGLTCLQRDCYDLFTTGSTTDGIYTIYPTGWESTGFLVYCEMSTNDGGWTVFQRRTTYAEIFRQNWITYKTGFGDANGDHWLGNNKLHTLTNQKAYQLRVDLELQAGAVTSYYALYDHFSISDETDRYRLSVGNYSGTAGDSLIHENGCQFSTYDQDNDKDATAHCSSYHQGAWWYSNRSQSRIACQNQAAICSNANLNGLATHGHDTHGTFWSTLTHSGSCSMKETRMRIRPI